MNPNICPPGQGNGNPGGGNNTVIIQQQPNLVINGAMTVSQRGTSFSSVSSTQYTLDRWELEFSGSPSAVVDVTRSSDAPTGSGLANSLKIDCTTAEGSVGASEAVVLKTTIEAQDQQQLMYGDEANAQNASLSFWVRSPKAGTHCVALYMDDGSVHNIQEFVVSVANKWELKHVIFPGYTAAAIANDNGAGLTLSFPLVAGTDFQATKEIWESGIDVATTGQQNLLDNVANDFYVTGVKLEVGEAATGLVHESYGETLRKCQRYFWRQINKFNEPVGIASIYNSTNGDCEVSFPVSMRAVPTLSFSNAGHFYLYATNTTQAPSAIAATGHTSEYGMNLGLTLSGATQGDAGNLVSVNADSTMEYDAEF